MSTSLGEGSVATVQLRADYQLDLTGAGVVTSNTAGQQRVTQVTGSATTIGPFSQDMTCVLVGGAGGLTFETSSSLAGVGGGAAAFTDLTDALDSYTGLPGSLLFVNTAENAVSALADLQIDPEAHYLQLKSSGPNNEDGSTISIRSYSTAPDEGGLSYPSGTASHEIALSTYAGGDPVAQPGGFIGQTVTFEDGTTQTLHLGANMNGAETAASAQAKLVLSGGVFVMVGFPTTDPHVVGALWVNSGVLTLSAGA